MVAVIRISQVAQVGSTDFCVEMPTVSRVSPEEVWGVHTDRRFTREKLSILYSRYAFCVIRLVGGGRLAIPVFQEGGIRQQCIALGGLNERGMAAVGAGVEGDINLLSLLVRKLIWALFSVCTPPLPGPFLLSMPVNWLFILFTLPVPKIQELPRFVAVPPAE